MPVAEFLNPWWIRLRSSAIAAMRYLRPRLGMRFDVLRYRLGIGVEARRAIRPSVSQPRFFFPSKDVPSLCARLRERLPLQAAEIVARAEQICRHRFDLLGYQNLSCGPKIDWQRELLRGRPVRRKPWYRLRQRDAMEAAEWRLLWELNRHQHLVTLAKAYWLSGNGAFATEIFCQWREWRKQNAYPMGINWASSREVALRSLSWLWLYYLLAESPQLPPGFREELRRALNLHARHLDRYVLTEPMVAGRLAEAVALFFIGTLCPELRRAESWKQKGWQIILEETRRLAGHAAEGTAFGSSTAEYVFSIDLLLHAGIFASLQGTAMPLEFEGALERMLDVLCLLSRSGPPPPLGTSYGGRVFDSARSHSEHMLDPLATGAILFGRGDFKYLAQEAREETFWLLGEQGLAEFDNLPCRRPRGGPAALPEQGLYLLADAQCDAQLVIDARIAGESSDGEGGVLGVSLNHGGQALLFDSGGSSPTVLSPASRPVHSTLVARRHEPSRRRPLRVQAEGWVSGESFGLFMGSRDLSSSPESAILHRRWVFALNSEFWLVRDLAMGDDAQNIGVLWHLCPQLIRFGGSSGIFVEAADDSGLNLLTVEGHGWSQDIRQSSWSPLPGCEEPLQAVQFGARSGLPAEFVTLLVPSLENAGDVRHLARIRQAPLRGVVTAYRYQTREEEHCMYFGEGRSWSMGPWASDAEFLYWGGTQDGQLRSLVTCNGTYADAGGSRILTCAAPLLRCEVRFGPGPLRLVSSDDKSVQLNQRVLEELAAGGAQRPQAQRRKIAVGQ